MSTSKHWGSCLRTTIGVMLGLAFLFGFMGAVDGGATTASLPLRTGNRSDIRCILCSIAAAVRKDG